MPTLEHGHSSADGSECAVAHGDTPAPTHDDRTLVAVYATPVATYLLHWGRELGFVPILVEPDPARVSDAHRRLAQVVVTDPEAAPVDETTDVVVTDHHRDGLGAVMAPLLAAEPRWMGIMGSARHEPPHVPALRAHDVDDDLIATVRRPIGLDIGSKEPAEIALATLAGLLADRNGRAGGHLDASTAATSESRR